MLETEELSAPDPDTALRLVMTGNERFITGRATLHQRMTESRLKWVDQQKPIAVILGCADSRAAPSLIFDLGLGELFIVRTVGHLVDLAGLASLNYAVAVLKTPLIIVLGHSSCGAVVSAKQKAIGGYIGYIQDAVRPAWQNSERHPGNPVENAIKEHSRLVAHELRQEKTFMADAIAAGQLKVQPAFYSFLTGKVILLDD